MMYPETLEAVTRRLLDDHAPLKPSSDGRWLQGGRCPSCGKKELYASAESPWRIQCGRLNQCGYSAEIRDLYPDLFTQWSKRHPVTPTDPHATATAYLREGRGLDASRLKGRYQQAEYYNPTSKQGSATIRFDLADGWWERLLEPKGDSPKARMKPGFSVRGHWWTPSGIDLPKRRELWICEGIFDAIALTEHGIAACSAMSCNNYPQHGLDHIAAACAERRLERPVLVWAFDADKAGREYTEKWAIRARQQGWECRAAQPPAADQKTDWNTLHQKGRLGPTDLDTYRYHGDLLLAEKPSDKALLIYHHTSQSTFPFDFENRLYWFKLDLDKFHKAAESFGDLPDHLTDEQRKDAEQQRRDDALLASGSLTEIVNCHPEPLYYQSSLLTDESWYYFRINFPKGAPVKNTFTGAQLSSASEFKKRLLAVAPGVIYTGNSGQLDRYLKTSIEGIKRVETIDYIGYCPERQAYLYHDLCIHQGKTYQLNADDHFELPRGLNIKSLAHSPQIQLNPDPADYDPSFATDLLDAWGPKGIIALTWWFGSLFAEQIRAQHKSYPFLELVGDPGAGKSTLLMFLWRLFGRSGHEGMDPNKSTRAGRLRTLSQVSNLPVIFVESDRDGSSGQRAQQFDWDELKNLFDGGAIGTRGLKNGGNETHEPPFRGTVAISQNATVMASKAIISRICHLWLETKGQTRASEAAARRLEHRSSNQTSGFMLRAIQSEAAILSTYTAAKTEYEEKLKDSGIRSFRIAMCHAMLMALFDAMTAHILPELANLQHLIHGTLLNMARERDALMEQEPQIVTAFWDLVERIEARDVSFDSNTVLNHSKHPDRLFAINLTQFYQHCRSKHYDLPPQPDLLQALRTSRRYRFIDANKTIHSALEHRSVRCWIFEKPQGDRHD